MLEAVILVAEDVVYGSCWFWLNYVMEFVFIIGGCSDKYFYAEKSKRHWRKSDHDSILKTYVQ